MNFLFFIFKCLFIAFIYHQHPHPNASADRRFPKFSLELLTTGLGFKQTHACDLLATRKMPLSDSWKSFFFSNSFRRIDNQLRTAQLERNNLIGRSLLALARSTIGSRLQLHQIGRLEIKKCHFNCRRVWILKRSTESIFSGAASVIDALTFWCVCKLFVCVKFEHPSKLFCQSKAAEIHRNQPELISKRGRR